MEYTLLLYGDETAWEQADAETRAAVYARHTEFMKRCAERGHTITGGAELAAIRSTRTVRGTADEVTMTDGPFAETTEQLGGFYVIDTDDVDDLCQLVGMLSDGEPIEIRPTVPEPEGT